MRFGRCLLGLGVLSGALVTPLARADAPADRLVPLLRSRVDPGRAHPLADERGRVPVLVRLAPGERAEERGLVPVAPGFGAAHFLPEELAVYRATNPDLPLSVSPPRRPLIDISSKWTHAEEYRAETGYDGSGVVVGIIDTGIDAAHPDFKDEDGKSRIAWFITRQAPLGVHPELEEAYGCTAPMGSPCAIINGPNIDLLLLSAPEGAPRDLAGHGTHVSSIAAGNGGGGEDPRFVGQAPRATLIVGAPSPGGGFSDPDILNAARFIFDRADELGMPAVVNVSLGSDFGPHDGTSALEEGLAAMVGDDQPGHILVVAAGNSGTVYQSSSEAYGPLGIHTEAHVSESASVRVPMSVPGLGGDVDGSGYVWLTFRPGDEVSVGLEGPDGASWVSPQPPGEEAGFDEDGVTAAVINNSRDSSSLTVPEASNGAIVAWQGRWPAEGELAVVLEGRGDAQLWVTGTGEAAPGLSVGLVFHKALLAGTISVPASHPELIAVGCVLNRNAWRPLGALNGIELASFGDLTPAVPDSACYFSGAGPMPNGAMKPDISAPGGLVGGAMSHDADPRVVSGSLFAQGGCPESIPFCHLLDDSHALTSGTSMSAPHVAGAIALLLQKDPTLTQAQVMDVLKAGAARASGVVPYDYQLGPGELDLLGSLQVLDEVAGNGEPSAARSFFVLSSPYVRPDPGWSVEGDVQLRHGDGSVALGIGGEDLTLVVDGGVVTQPLTRVRGGLWRFAFSAPPGSGGRRLSVDVRFRGQSLGARELPIGVDAWVAETGVEALGGCALGGATRGRGAWLGLVTGGMLLLRRRSRARRGRTRASD